MTETGKGSERPFNAERMAWIEQVQDDREMGPAGVSVAVAIARHLNRRTGVAYPSQTTLAGKVGIQPRQLRNVLRRLETAGHLIVEAGGFQRPDTYRPAITERQSSAAISPATECRSKTGNPVSPIRQSSAVQSGNPVPPNLILEPEKEPVCSTDTGFSNDEEALAYVADLITKANVEADPRKVLLGCKSHHGEAWQSKLKGWTLGAIARSVEKPRPLKRIYDGPEEIRDDVIRARGLAYAASYIETCRWREEDRTILARHEFMAKRLVEDMGREWLSRRELNVGVMPANDAQPATKPKGRVGWV